MMSPLMLFTRVLVFVLVYSCLGVHSSNVDCGSRNDVKTIVVDLQPGHGNYTKIQDAVNSIPTDNTQWIAIHLNPGVYIEQVNITQPCILLQGNSRDDTSIELDRYVNIIEGGSPFDSATFTTNAENFVAKSITFKNTYNLEAHGERNVSRAVAAAILGDKSSFYDCGFIGVQDTLADAIGRHYFHNCHIEGAMDFIWGSGQSIYEYCEILVRTYPDPGILVRSVITAQTRESSQQKSGFVFKSGKLNGAGNPLTVLGRALHLYSTVLFKNMTFSGGDGLAVNIVPERWDNLGQDTAGMVYAEADNTGLGSEILNRTLEKNLTPEQWNYYTDMSFIDEDGWLGQQP